ncbi:MAG: radical SAM protein [Alphaproteobacteria bacterium]|nr:radical SAM protein [Alphaproteobacteria bacterium]
MGITQRIDAVTRIPENFRRTELPAPRSVKIELTGRCNYACSFCARSQRLRRQEEMDRPLYERLTVEMRQAGVEELGVFYLGESFMCQWLPEAIAHAKKVAGFPYVFLTTNGSLATPERVAACFRAGLDSLKFSVNWADGEQFEAIAGVKEALFRATKDNIKAARDARDRVAEETGHRGGLYASYIEYDGAQKARMETLLAEIRPYVDELYALPLYNQAAFVAEQERAQGWKPIAGNRGRVGALRDPLPCWAVFTEGHVTWDGQLSACCFDHDGRFHMGDLTREPFMQAWNSPAFRGLRAAHLLKDVAGTVCERCVAYQ